MQTEKSAESMKQHVITEPYANNQGEVDSEIVAVNSSHHLMGQTRPHSRFNERLIGRLSQRRTFKEEIIFNFEEVPKDKIEGHFPVDIQPGFGTMMKNLILEHRLSKSEETLKASAAYCENAFGCSER